MTDRESSRQESHPFYTQLPKTLKLCWRGKTWSADILSRKADSASAALGRLKVKPAGKIAVMVKNPLDFSRLFLAAIRANLIFVPLSAAWKSREVQAALKLISPALIIADEPFISHFEHETAAVVATKTLLQEADGQEEDFRPLGARPEGICTILFTSGTTGTPSAVQLTRRNFSASADSWQHLLRFTPRDHYLNCLPLYHIGGMSILTRALHSGFKVTFTEAFDARKVNALIDQGGISLISLVPTMLAGLLEERREAGFPSALRAVVLGGGPVPQSLLARCRAAKVPVVFTYGMTETCSGIAGWELDPSAAVTENLHLKIGRPFKNVSLDVELGELVVRGPMVMRGYLGEEVSGGVHRSGDLGYADDRGKYYLDLRREDLIVTGGENVNPREVEAVLMGHPQICDCAVIGLADDQWGQLVAAFVVCKDRITEREAFVESVKQFCRDQLANFKIPKVIRIVETLPRNALGKIDRSHLRGMGQHDSD